VIEGVYQVCLLFVEKKGVRKVLFFKGFVRKVKKNEKK
tara:strand:- start:35 stop:148 length:114 start_codon:yes stop_codon:yes gene_type:complete